MSSSPALSAEQTTTLSEVFLLFDTDRDGKISAAEAKSALSMMGLEAGFEARASFPIAFPAWCELLTPKLGDYGSSMSDCFASFDTLGAGKMPLADMRHALARLGDPLSDAEQTRFTERLNPGSDGMINTASFSAALAT
jgi:calmodulin